MSVLVIGFGVLSVLYPIIAISKGEYGLDGMIITGYYGFFTLFFLGIIIRQKHLMEYCGFVNSYWIKSLFYIFCASLAFANFSVWPCDVVGGIFGFCAILNVIRICGGSNDINEVK